MGLRTPGGRHAMLFQSRVLGPDSPDVATLYNNVGAVYMVQGKYEEALASLHKCLIIRIRVLGQVHPHTTASKRAIAAIHSATQARILRRIFQFGNPLVSSFT